MDVIGKCEETGLSAKSANSTFGLKLSSLHDGQGFRAGYRLPFPALTTPPIRLLTCSVYRHRPKTPKSKLCEMRSQDEVLPCPLDSCARPGGFAGSQARTSCARKSRRRGGLPGIANGIELELSSFMYCTSY